MDSDESLASERFLRSSKYHPEWVLAGVSGGANPLWMTEWLAEALDLRPGMRVLDLGCGKAVSSIFLRREFGVQVWATDLWFSASENLQRFRDAGILRIGLDEFAEGADRPLRIAGVKQAPGPLVEETRAVLRRNQAGVDVVVHLCRVRRLLCIHQGLRLHQQGGVDLGGWVAALLGDGHEVERPVQLTVDATVEAVPGLVQPGCRCNR